MLYKKYHRKHTRRFKKGVKLGQNNCCEVTREPYRIGRSIEIEINYRYIWTIVDVSGKIYYNKYPYVI